jgi:hypothetical protein
MTVRLDVKTGSEISTQAAVLWESQRAAWRELHKQAKTGSGEVREYITVYSGLRLS